MSSGIDTFDQQLTALAFRLSGNDRFTVLEAASKLRRYREIGVRVKAELDLL
jgi:hypothetical protein